MCGSIPIFHYYFIVATHTSEITSAIGGASVSKSSHIQQKLKINSCFCVATIMGHMVQTEPEIAPLDRERAEPITPHANSC